MEKLTAYIFWYYESLRLKFINLICLFYTSTEIHLKKVPAVISFASTDTTIESIRIIWIDTDILDRF